jgi:hypothetical protein
MGRPGRILAAPGSALCETHESATGGPGYSRQPTGWGKEERATHTALPALASPPSSIAAPGAPAREFAMTATDTMAPKAMARRRARRLVLVALTCAAAPVIAGCGGSSPSKVATPATTAPAAVSVSPQVARARRVVRRSSPGSFHALPRTATRITTPQKPSPGASRVQTISLHGHPRRTRRHLHHPRRIGRHLPV